MQRRTFIKIAASCTAAGIVQSIVPARAFAENDGQKELVENSWRFDNGEPIPQDEGPQTYSGTPAWSYNGSGWVNGQGQLCPNVIRRGIDVSYAQGAIDWDRVKADDVSFAIIRCGYWTNKEDKWWDTNASACQRLGIPFGAYLYSYATNADEARREAQNALNIVRGYNLSYPIFFDMEDDDLLGGDYAAMAKAFCDTITAAGYRAGVYANLNWWNNYLTDPVFENWTRWVAQYKSSATKPNYAKSYGFWQCTSSGAVDGISGNVDINFEYPAGNGGLTQEEIASGKFYDTPANEWYMRDGWIQYAASAGLMQGDKDPNTGKLTGYFRPDDPITRGQIATMLYRFHNPNSDAASNPNHYGTVSNFHDVATGRYFTAPIEWARANEIITGDRADGKPTGYFRPDGNITREEFATMVYRYASFAGADMEIRNPGSINSMIDANSISGFAHDAMVWCAENGVITGSNQANGAYAYPQNSATRAEGAKIITVLTRDVL